MNDPLYNSLRESSWRRKLSLAEEAELRAWLGAHPEAQADWEAETGLTAALGRLPDAPMPSNFTARVLQAVERETAAQAHGRKWGAWFGRVRWLPRAALAVLLLGAGFLGYHESQRLQSDKIVNGVRIVSKVTSMPSPEILQDFDAIRVMNQTPPADVQLLTLLQ